MSEELRDVSAKVDRLSVRLAAFELTLIPLLIAEISRPREGERLEDRPAHLQSMRSRARTSLQEYGGDTSPEPLDLVGAEVDMLFDHLAFQIDSAMYGS